MAATMSDDGRGLLVCGSRRGHGLRVWEPTTGTLQHMVLDVAVTCLAAAGSDVVVGHESGVFRISLPRG
ncbi:hypothetical protein N7U49_39890 [Streptomyces sp. AD2-2]|nr:hypothetical protein N7U49_39890 [Streptomyces sp. AD2-2]